MIFPSEKKKELWRYASRNNTATFDGQPMQPPQQPRPPHQRHPQMLLLGSCSTEESTINQDGLICHPHTPPPPYTSIPYALDCSGSYRQQQTQRVCRVDADVSASVSTMGASDNSSSAQTDYTIGGCSCASFCDDMLVDENDLCQPSHNCRPHLLRSTPAATTTPLTATAFAISAANMLRICCCGSGRTSGNSTESSAGSHTSSRRHTHNHSRHHNQRICYPHSKTSNSKYNIPPCPVHLQPPAMSTSEGVPSRPTNGIGSSTTRSRNYAQDFNALMKHVKKNKQQSELLRAVKSRIDPSISARQLLPAPSYLQCILVKCTSPVDEEQHVTACRLFFWSDLKSASELKRLPTCPSAHEYVYVCCNPLHWYRIIQPIDSEIAPPPYQCSKMLRLKDADSEGNSQNIDKCASSWVSQSNSISSIIKGNDCDLYGSHLQSMQSFTTDGEDRTAYSKVWCRIAYWELSQRVGDFFNAKKSAVNIHTDGLDDCVGDSMCLWDLSAKRSSAAPDAVQNTRNRIGLGVTLSVELDDVWVFNRGNVPIFVDSPTLSERLDRVCKVLPGCCLKAFDTHRAQMLACKQPRDHQLGPVDRFSMRISFAKGWGPFYRRPDIMGCPCWLEVHFSQLR